MRVKSIVAGLALLALAGIQSEPARAAVYVIDASANSSSGGGVGLNTVTLNAGQSFSVSVNLTDLWNAGPLPRWSDANGLTHDFFATGTDESGQIAGTKIGQNFGTYTQGNLTAPYGTLVGQIGSGDFFVLGSSYTGVASASGVLKLYYWDSNNSDNTNGLTVSVSAVPETSTWIMMLIGFAGVGYAAYRTKARSAAASA